MVFNAVFLCFFAKATHVHMDGKICDICFVLFKGARCEPHTFDGERCIYAALTNRIRKLLKDYKAITPDCMRRDSYREFFRRYTVE